MAKQPPRSPASGKVKVRVFEFEMDGSDESIQDTMKTLAAALTRGGNGPVPVSRRLKAGDHGAGVLPASAPDLDEGEVGEGEETEIEDVVPKPPEERKPAAPRKPVAVKVLNGISFTDVQPTLKQFYESKAPGKNITANYLVVAYWFKHYRGIEELTVDHFHTAFRHVGFATPRNPLQPIRDLRNNRDGRLMGGSAANTCIIHHLGENYVHEMNKAGD